MCDVFLGEHNATATTTAWGHDACSTFSRAGSFDECQRGGGVGVQGGVWGLLPVVCSPLR